MTLNANDFFCRSLAPKAKHNPTKPSMLFARPEICQKFQAIIRKYAERTGWEFDSRYQATPPVTNISLSPTDDDALKTATRINIPAEIPSRAGSDISFHIHACIHTMKIENGKLFARLEGCLEGTRRWTDSVHCFPPSGNTSRRERANEHRKEKIF